MKAQLTFINRSYDINRSDVIIFQRNEATKSSERPIAWKVIKRCPVDWSHPFTFSSELHARIRDSNGNLSPRVPVALGTRVQVCPRPQGIVELVLGHGEDPESIHVENRLEVASFAAEIYRDGRLLSCSRTLAPHTRAVFRFDHRIFVVAASGIDEGDLLRRSDLHWRTLTRLNLLSVTSADIIMTGGGYGPDATLLRFRLHRVKTWLI